MPFHDAIPVNRIAGAAGGFEAAERRGRPGSAREPGRATVNISEETAMRLAREKLSRAMTRKLAYGAGGEVKATPSMPGTLFSAKA